MACRSTFSRCRESAACQLARISTFGSTLQLLASDMRHVHAQPPCESRWAPNFLGALLMGAPAKPSLIARSLCSASCVQGRNICLHRSSRGFINLACPATSARGVPSLQHPLRLCAVFCSQIALVSRPALLCCIASCQERPRPPRYPGLSTPAHSRNAIGI